MGFTFPSIQFNSSLLESEAETDSPVSRSKINNKAESRACVCVDRFAGFFVFRIYSFIVNIESFMSFCVPAFLGSENCYFTAPGRERKPFFTRAREERKTLIIP